MDPVECDEQTSYPVNLVELSVEEAKASIERAPEPSALCRGGRNCLFYVVQRAREDEALELLNYILDRVPGLDATIPDDFGQTPLFYAAREGHTACLQWLVSRCSLDPSHVDNASQTPLFYAARDGRLDTIVWLVEKTQVDINHVDGNGETPLFYAARDGREKTVLKMIELGADPSVRNKKKAYASAIARKNGHRALATELDSIRKQREASGSSTRTAPESKKRPAARKAPVTARASARRKRPLPAVEEVPPRKRRGRRGDDESPLEVALRSKSPSASETEEIATPLSGRRGGKGSLAAMQPPSEPVGLQSVMEQASVGTDPPPSPISPDGQERQIYQLQFLAPGKAWSFATLPKLEEFEALYPEIAVWDKSGTLPIVGLEQDPYRSKWHDQAMELMKYLCTLKGAWLFDAPVDPEKWNITDYFDIVKNPMDFCTIKERLKKGTHYRTVKEFIKDLELVFYNCILYNSGESEVGQVCSRIRSLYLNQSRRLGLLDLLEAEDRRSVISKKIAESALAKRNSQSGTPSLETTADTPSASSSPCANNFEAVSPPSSPRSVTLPVADVHLEVEEHSKSSQPGEELQLQNGVALKYDLPPAMGPDSPPEPMPAPAGEPMGAVLDSAPVESMPQSAPTAEMDILTAASDMGDDLSLLTIADTPRPAEKHGVPTEIPCPEFNGEQEISLQSCVTHDMLQA
eukprot:Protomagalhaensia_sp_Gyna_25__5772@NODE_840_length_2524_cov_5_675252_g662_i0_p1_GENE_NODE_840_length_2524_cov_5_675252_g662_i0NODE_840_length_2524_cov_5_675252_g662_i0_p1_ORF_typecomplete_len693_score86_01Ank_4/PF13637_6/3_8e07Ank_4/PF13637_6/1_7e12Ank_4/PF13637_6/0_00028Ank_2/PF12796_7/1_4e13Ank_2/PF12796_7/1_2e06Ank_5/PF13857_6/0_00017Ank_5/PF13857_6/0_0045Ank_5/PF13857_6/1_7e09Bromodomain/PF00439_25/1_2e21Ank_3/PF13606_6/1_8e03Ank_3/PF13606_6/0_0004Ank_3/PF13606_6/0_0099Ank_3/PF13606_6/4_1e06